MRVRATLALSATVALSGCLDFSLFLPEETEDERRTRPDNDDEDDDNNSGEGEQPCTEIFPDAIDGTGTDGVYVGTYSPDTGNPGDDVLVFEFIGASTGTNVLGSGDNASYATCTACVGAFEGATSAERSYFADSGFLILDEDPLGGRLLGRLQNVRLVEVTIDEASFTSTPVPGGACLTIGTATLDSGTPPPAP